MVLVWFVAIVCYLGDLISHEMNSGNTKSVTISPKDVGYFDHIDVPEIKVPGFDLFFTTKGGKSPKGADQRLKQNTSSTQRVMFRQLNPIQEDVVPYTGDRRLDVENGYNRHSFNVAASDRINSRRQVPDTRPKQ